MEEGSWRNVYHGTLHLGWLDIVVAITLIAVQDYIGYLALVNSCHKRSPTLATEQVNISFPSNNRGILRGALENYTRPFRGLWNYSKPLPRHHYLLPTVVLLSVRAHYSPNHSPHQKPPQQDRTLLKQRQERLYGPACASLLSKTAKNRHTMRF